MEIQKLGYAFLENSACYTADLLLRQYKRAQDKRNRERGSSVIKTSKRICHSAFEKKPLWNFISMEKEYLHKSDWSFDTGLELDLLQNFIFITLDIFQKHGK